MKAQFARTIAIIFILAAIGCESSESAETDNGVATDTQTGTDNVSQTDINSAINPHPYWENVDWDSFFPGPEMSAVYHVTTFGQDEKDLTAHVVYDVEWKGGTWTQLVVGVLEPGNDGMAIYFDKTEPWVIKAKGVEVYDADTTDGPVMVEYFYVPIVVPLSKSVAETTEFSTTINGNYSGFEDSMGVNYSIAAQSYDWTQTVPAGEYGECAKIIATLTGELIGSGSVEAEIVAHPTQTIIRWVDSPGFILAELKSEWQ